MNRLRHYRDRAFARGHHRMFVRVYCTVWGAGLIYAVLVKPIIAILTILFA